MKYRVDLIFTDTGAQVPFFEMEDGVVSPLCPSGKEVAKDGIIVKAGVTLFPKDGMAFMEGLRIAFSGSMVRATAPYEFRQ